MTKFAGLAGLSLAAITALAVPSAVQAQTATGPGTPYNAFDSANNAGTFGNNGSLANTTFTNVFTFVVTQAGTLASDFSNTATRNNSTTDIDFSGATLSGGTLTSAVSFVKLLGEPISLTEVWGLTGPLSVGAGTYTLSISGRSYGNSATYSGNFAVAGVPEPTTWALMMIGVGVAGAALRRRQRVAVRFA